ncbi:hypothetical protein ACFE04_022643 [Oxalis oulophora]
MESVGVPILFGSIKNINLASSTKGTCGVKNVTPPPTEAYKNISNSNFDWITPKKGYPTTLDSTFETANVMIIGENIVDEQVANLTTLLEAFMKNVAERFDNMDKAKNTTKVVSGEVPPIMFSTQL